MTPDELYQQLIVEHDRAPHHCGPLPEATHAATIDNPLCGDVVTVRLVLAGDTIERIAFEGRGCALSRAAASIMTDRVTGSTIADATALRDTFERFVAEAADAPVPDELGDLAAFRGVRAFRSRRTCATLAFHALARAGERVAGHCRCWHLQPPPLAPTISRTPIWRASCARRRAMKTPVCTRFLAIALLAALPLTACVAEDDGALDDGKSDSSDRLLDLPFYFAIPKAAISVPLDRPKYPYPTVWNPAVQDPGVGLRIIAVQQGTSVASHQAARRDMAAKLAAAGVLQEGDIALTFRPELAGTMAYPHIQMGITHSGLVYMENGQAFNIDSPLDSEYVGQFDTSHYAGNGGDDAGTNALHIVRPRAMTPERRAQLHEWIETLKSGLSRINGERAQIKFQSDYLIPAYKAAGMTTRQTITRLGKIILEVDTTSKQPMYCSEFAWHMLALSNCTAEQIRNAPAEGADCVDEVFAPMPLTEPAAGQIGMADGPLRSLLAIPAENRAGLVDSIFATGDAAKLSSGHRMVAEQVAPLMVPLSQLYAARATGASVEEVSPIANMLNVAVANNYSPTTFLVQSVEDDRLRVMDYVVTVEFVNASDFAKAKKLSKLPVP